jgi:hypothetical protein
MGDKKEALTSILRHISGCQQLTIVFSQVVFPRLISWLLSSAAYLGIERFSGRWNANINLVYMKSSRKWPPHSQECPQYLTSSLN